MKHHNAVKSIKCSKCEHACLDSSSLKNHMMKHSSEKPYTCRQCDFRAKQLSSVKTHTRIHSGLKAFKCDQCDFATHQAGNLRTHVRTHTGGKPYKCDQCHLSMSQSAHLKRHKMTHIKESEKTHKCNYASPRPENLQSHVKGNHGPKHHKCSQCDYAAYRKDSLLAHLTKLIIKECSKTWMVLYIYSYNTQKFTVFTVWHWGWILVEILKHRVGQESEAKFWVRVAFGNVLTMIGSFIKLFENFYLSSVYCVYWANFISRPIQIFWSLSCRYFQALNTTCTTIRTVSTIFFWKLVIDNELNLFVKGSLFTSGESFVCNCRRSRKPLLNRGGKVLFIFSKTPKYSPLPNGRRLASQKYGETIIQNKRKLLKARNVGAPPGH